MFVCYYASAVIVNLRENWIVSISKQAAGQAYFFPDPVKRPKRDREAPAPVLLTASRAPLPETTPPEHRGHFGQADLLPGAHGTVNSVDRAFA